MTEPVMAIQKTPRSRAVAMRVMGQPPAGKTART